MRFLWSDWRVIVTARRDLRGCCDIERPRLSTLRTDRLPMVSNDRAIRPDLMLPKHHPFHGEATTFATGVSQWAGIQHDDSCQF